MTRKRSPRQTSPASYPYIEESPPILPPDFGPTATGQVGKWGPHRRSFKNYARIAPVRRPGNGPVEKPLMFTFKFPDDLDGEHRQAELDSLASGLRHLSKRSLHCVENGWRLATKTDVTTGRLAVWKDAVD